jgi:CHAT domain-containing protein
MPVWKAIESVSRLMIVPHGVLHRLPFAALWFRNSSESPERLYLCQRFQISILPSVAFFQYALDVARPVQYEGNALILGNPTLDLPGSAREATAVAKLLNVAPLIGSKALRERVLHPAKEYGLIHIASHGVYDERDPLLSGVVLADGRLSVEDLLEGQISAELLTLSGCVTGVSAQHAGDELIGLSRAALSAGIPSVITTLWEVQDDVAAEFFERFYTNLRDGMGKDKALCVTQLSMIADPHYKNPGNWAPYVLLGYYR